VPVERKITLLIQKRDGAAVSCKYTYALLLPQQKYRRALRSYIDNVFANCRIRQEFLFDVGAMKLLDAIAVVDNCLDYSLSFSAAKNQKPFGMLKISVAAQYIGVFFPDLAKRNIVSEQFAVNMIPIQRTSAKWVFIAFDALFFALKHRRHSR